MKDIKIGVTIKKESVWKRLFNLFTVRKLETVSEPSEITVFEVGGHELKLYASIKELPHRIGKKMNMAVIKEAGIGSSVADIDDHLARLREFVSKGHKEDALKEIKNMRLSMFSGVFGIDHKSQAFACLIHSIDGKPITDYSEENLIAIMEKLPINSREIEYYLEDVKKNLIPNAG
jgi:hypothetical protein